MSLGQTVTSIQEPTKQHSWEDLKVVYKVRKLGRRADPFHKAPPMVMSGLQFDGLECRLANMIVEEGGRIENQDPEGFVPKIGARVSVNTGRWNSGNNWLRTSLVEDFYIHGDETGQISKDKIVVLNPADGFLLDQIKEWKKGDIVITTANSMYHFEAVRN